MAITIEVPDGEAALTDFLLFRDRVYASRPVRWPTLTGFFLPALMGQGPFADGRSFHPVLARRDGEPYARAVAVIDDRYRAAWNNDPLGHVILFEALPDARDETRAVMDAACGWLREHGMQAARTGFGMQDMPYVLDDYDSLPPIILRHNPPEYHALLKDAGFQTEKGWVDYKIKVTPELIDRWERSLEGARRAGFEIVPLREIPSDRRTSEFAETWTDAFAEHWGNIPWTHDEFALVFDLIGPLGMYDTSVIAYRDGEPAGALWVTPELSGGAEAFGRPLRDDEKLNWLGIGVRKPARGTGLNMAMASYAFLELVRRGSTWVSYTLVLDDNWPSRRTGEKLGGSVCANYVVYRRNFRHRDGWAVTAVPVDPPDGRAVR